MQEYFSTLAEKIAASIPNIIAALLIFAISLYFARLLGNLLKRVLLKRNTASGVTYLLSDILRWTIIVFGVLTALQRFFNVAAFLTGLGILGFTVGFALQNVMQNFVSGIILLVQQPFKVGDEIGVLHFEGVVLQINLRTTEMQTYDGRIAILPNADVLSNVIVNYTRAKRIRVDLPMSFTYGTNPEKVRELIHAELKNVAGFVQAPAPEVLFHNFGASSIDLLASFWIDTSIAHPAFARDDALVHIRETFKKNEIEIPAPPQKIYIQNGK